MLGFSLTVFLLLAFGTIALDVDSHSFEQDFSVGLLAHNQNQIFPSQRSSETHPSNKSHKRSIVVNWHSFFYESQFHVPRSLSDVLKNDNKTTDGIRVTYYNEPNALKNPSCGDSNTGKKWAPNDDSFVAAVTTDKNWKTSEGKPDCLNFINVTSSNGKSVVVRVVDSCSGSGCATDGNHTVDLTEAAFRKLDLLNKGVLSNAKIQVVSKPGGSRWTKSDTRKYGPKVF